MSTESTDKYPWQDPVLDLIEVPAAFVEDLLELARRWDAGDTTTADDVALLEVVIGYLSGNLSEQETIEPLNIDLPTLRAAIRDAAQNGMGHVGKEGKALLQLSGFDRKVKPVSPIDTPFADMPLRKI